MGAVNPLEAFTEQAIDAEMAAAAEAEAIQAVSDKNEAFLSVLGNVSGAMDDYQAAQSDANTALAEGKMTAEEHAAKMAELAGAYEEAKNRIVLSIVEMKLASDGWTNAELQSYLNIGEQLGVFDAEMVATTSSYIQQADKMVAAGGNQEIMFKRLAGRSDDAREEFINMKQSQAELADALRRDAVPAVGALNVALANIKDQQVYVDIFFREHGGSGATFTAPVIGGGAGYQTGIHLEGAGRALGGPLLENGYTIVGDSPGGWSPWAEVVTPDGKVLPHNVSQQLKDAGMLDDARRMAFGSADEVALYSPTQADYAIGNRNRAYRAYRASGSGVSAASMPAGAGDDIAAPAMYAAAADVMPNTNAGLVSTVHDGQVQQTNATGQTNELLKELIREIRKSKPPTAQEMAKATYEGSSKFS